MSRHRTTSRPARRLSWRKLWHVLALLVLIVQTLPLQVALAAPASQQQPAATATSTATAAPTTATPTATTSAAATTTATTTATTAPTTAAPTTPTTSTASAVASPTATTAAETATTEVTTEPSPTAASRVAAPAAGPQDLYLPLVTNGGAVVCTTNCAPGRGQKKLYLPLVTSNSGICTANCAPANLPPVAKDSHVPIGPSGVATVDLKTLASDPNNDPLTFAIDVDPLRGKVSIAGSMLTYTPNDGNVTLDTLRYKVTAVDGTATAALTIYRPGAPTALHVTPGSVMFTAAGQSRLFSVKAYDGNGDEVSTAGLNIEWVTNDASKVSIAAGADAATATVSSLVDIGMAVVSARSRSNPNITTGLVAVTMARPAAGVQLVRDDELAFPLGSLIPNKAGSPYPLGPDGKPVIAGFTAQEIRSFFEKVPGTDGSGLGLRYPVVLKGAAPAAGTIMLASESAPVMGRVTTKTPLQRNGYTLVQVELVSFLEAFDRLDFNVSGRALIQAGLAKPEQFIVRDPQAATAGVAPSGISFPGAAPQPAALLDFNIGKCKVESGGSLAGITLSPIGELDPDLDVGLTIGENANGKFVESAKFIASLRMKIGVQAGINFGLTSTTTVDCPLSTPLKFGLPNAGIMTLFNLLLGPAVTLEPKAGLQVVVQAGPTVGLAPKLEYEVKLTVGFSYANPTGGDTTGAYTAVRDFTSTPLKDVFSWGGDGFANMSEFAQAKIGVSFSLYESGKGVLRVGGALWDFLDDIGLDEVSGEIEVNLTLDFLEVKIGPVLSVEWGSPELVLNTKQNAASAKLNFKMEGAFKSEALEKIQEKLRLKVVTLDIKLFDITLPGWSFYDELKAGTNTLTPNETTAAGKTVTFDVTPQGPEASSAEVWYNGERLTSLTPAGGKLTGTWTVTDAICKASEESTDPLSRVKLDVIAYNRMLNGTMFSFPMPDAFKFLPVPNYVGEIEISCKKLTADVQLAPDPSTMDNQTITACMDQSGVGEYKLAINAQAKDTLKKLQKLQMIYDPKGGVEKPVGSDPGEMSESTDLTLKPDDPANLDVYAVAFAPTTTEPARKAESKHVKFAIKWYICRDVTKTETRTRASDCFTISEQRERKDKEWVDPATGTVVKRKEGQWSAWHETGRTPTGVCTFIPSSGGDPHLMTPDGLAYDTFSLGEFVYLQPQAGKDGITIQARQERITDTGSRLRFHAWTSWNTAFAIKAGGHVFELDVNNLTRPLVDGVRAADALTPGLHSYGDVDIKVNSANEIELSYANNRLIVNQVLGFLEMRPTVPQDDTLIGMLGRPNGLESDDFRLPDGTTALSAFAMADGWRITDRAKSLFTYADGQGPETFNKAQDREPPSAQELAPYVDQARQILAGACKADTIDPVAVNNTALELYTGRTPEDLTAAGVCWYNVQGKVTNSLVAGVPVPGAKVTLTSNELNTCETYTDRNGAYQCFMPALGKLPTITATVSGKGQGQAQTSFTALPPMNGMLGAELNLQVAPTTLQMTGFVTDGAGKPLYNAEVRITGPEQNDSSRAYSQADGAGKYNAYLMLSDGITGGSTSYKVFYTPSWSTEPTAPGIGVDLNRTLPALDAQRLNVVSETLVLTGSRVLFSGRVSYAAFPDQTLPGVRVQITPKTPIAGWAGCDVKTLEYREKVSNPYEQTADASKVGTYRCELATDRTDPFDVEIKVAGQGTPQVVTVNPAGHAVGEAVPVVANFALPATALRVSGVVKDTLGRPVVGAELTLSDAGSFNRSITVLSGPDGRYEAVFGYASTATTASVGFGLHYRDLDFPQYANATYSGLVTGQANERSRDFVIGGRRLSFSGRVADGYSASARMAGSVTISSPTCGGLCATSIASDGSYTCTAVVELGFATSMDLEYVVSGIWGNTTVATQIGDLPALAETRAVPRDFTVYPTTLRLSGMVSTPSGAPLAGARVGASGPGFGEAISGEDGSYLMDIVPTAPITSGQLSYQVSFRTGAVTGTQSFTAAPGQLTTVQKNFSYAYHLVYLRGAVRNPYGIDMPYSSVEISSPQFDAACVTQTTPDGGYVCAAQTGATGAITASYTISGFWGSNTFTETITAAPDQDSVTHVADLLVSPTALRLKGHVADPAGAPLKAVEITAAGQSVYREAMGYTGPYGDYDFYVLLKTPSTTEFTRTLVYRVGYGTATTSRTLQFVGKPNALVEINQDFSLQTRVLQFKGRVKNALAEQADLPGARVVVVSPQLGKLCEYSSLERYGSAMWSCDAQLFTDQPFDVEYRLNGAWGSRTFTGTVTIVPDLGERNVLDRTFEVSPTTVLLKGHVADRDGKPLAGARVGVTGAVLLASAEKQTDLNGNYSMYAVVQTGVTTTTLNYTVWGNNDAPIQLSREIVATADARTEHVEDFKFTSRKLTLSGKLRNTTDPNIALGGKLVIVSPTLDQRLCETSINNGAYSCETLIQTDLAFNLNYRVEGPWGVVEALAVPVPAGASAFAKDLDAQPRVLYLKGAVTNGAGAAVAGARVDISSYNIVPGQLTSLGGATGADGTYAGAVALGDGVLSGDLQYKVSRDGAEATTSDSFTFAGSTRAVTVSHDLVLKARLLRFSGAIFNTVMNSAGSLGSTRVVISSPALGKLCEVYASNSYACQLSVDVDQPFDLVYSMRGDWGSATAEGRVDSVPPPGQAIEIKRDLQAAPAMLQVSGKVVDRNGAGIPNVPIQPAPGSVAAIWGNARTDGNGVYALTVVLKQWTAGQSGTLGLQATFGAATLYQNVPFTASPGQLTTMDASTLAFRFEERTLIFSGKLINTLAPTIEAAQPAGKIAVRDVSGTLLCPISKATAYSCPVKLYSSEPFEALISVDEDWGHAEKHVVLSSVPEAGQTQTYANNLEVAPTTLHVAGQVTFPVAGGPKPVPGASVNVTLPVEDARGGNTMQGKTDINGNYDIWTVLPAGFAGQPLKYRLTYDGIDSTFVVENVTVPASQLNFRKEDFSFAERRVRFNGKLTNKLAAGQPLRGRITITSADMFSAHYCDASADSQGNYSCDAMLTSSQPISVNYRIGGGWGGFDVKADVTDIPDAGGSVLVTRNLDGSPTTLQVSGTVADQYGKPLDNAEVRISGLTLAAPATLRTAADGSYSVYLVVNKDQTDGDLQFRISYYQAALSKTESFFGLTREALNSRAFNFTLQQRAMTFDGRVRHKLVPDLGVPGTLRISSPTEGTLCQTTTSAAGDYLCNVPAVTTEAFSATYTLSGDWGSATTTDSVPFGRVGGSNEFNKLWEAMPPTLRLHGSVTSGGQPLANVTVKAASDSLSRLTPSATMTTDAQGAYSGYVVVKGDIREAALNYQVFYNGAAGSYTVGYSVQPDQVTDVAKNIDFSQRVVTFKGKLLNAHVPGLGIGQSTVELRSPTVGALCTVTTAVDGSYQCSFQVLNGNGFDVAYTANGAWGTASASGSVPAGASAVTFEQNILAYPTTLRLAGTVSDAQGQPLPGGSIRIVSSGMIGVVSTQSDQSGTYAAYALLNKDTTYTTLNYTVALNSTSVSSSLSQRFAHGALALVSNNLTLAARSFAFSGTVGNALAAGRGLGWTQVTVSSPTLGTLCSANTGYGSSYSCSKQLNVAEPFDVVYTVSGAWGQETITGPSISQLPAVGATAAVQQNLQVSPATVRLKGIVRDPAGTALPSATVDLSANTSIFANVGWPLQATTTVTGSYELLGVLKQGVTSGQLTYNVTYKGIVVSPTGSFAAPAGQQTDVSKDLTVDKRQIVFRGAVTNALAPGEKVSITTLNVAASGLGQICAGAISWNDPSTYSCTAQVADTATLSVTYTLAGDWGTATITGTAAAGSATSSIDVARDLPVTPTTLHLTGTVVDADGTKLSGATVTINGWPNFSGGSIRSAQTQADGTYSVFVPLKAGVTSGNLDYSVRYNTVTVTGKGSFSAQVQKLTALDKAFTISERKLSFSGSMFDGFAPETGVGAQMVTVDAPGHGQLCTWGSTATYAGHGQTFGCTATITDTRPLSVTYTAVGDWGTQVITGADVTTFPPIGGTQQVLQNLQVKPTTLRISGVVRQPNNGPVLQNATVTVSGAALSAGNPWQNRSTQTDASGGYSLTLVVKKDVTTVPLDFAISYGSVTVHEAHEYGVTPDALTTATQNFEFNTREIVFYGSLTNALTGGTPLPATAVSVGDAGLGTLCTWTSSGYTSYSCTAPVRTTGALSVTYTITGTWGTGVVTGTVAGGNIGTRNYESRTLALSPTTLHLTGFVRDGNNTGLGSAWIEVDGDGVAVKGQGYTVGDGGYEVYAVLKPGVTSGKLRYKVSSGGKTTVEQADFTAQPNALTAVTHDVTLITRQASFTLNMVNARRPSEPMAARSVRVESPWLPVLCDRPWYYSAVATYSCSPQVYTSASLPITYTVGGDWGSSVVTGTLPAGAQASTTALTVTLPITGTMLRLTGSVRDPQNVGLAGAKVQVWGNNFSDGNATTVGTTGADGTYDFYILLQPGAQSGTLSYSVTYKDAHVNGSQSFNVAAGQEQTLDQSFTIRERYLAFNLKIANSLAPGTYVPSKHVLVTSPTRGNLCELSWYYSQTTFTCSATITETEGLTVGYTVEGDWGSRVIPAAPVDLPAIGETAHITQDLPVEAAAVQYKGTVFGENESALPNINVEARSVGFVDGYTRAASDATGAYTATGVLKQGVTAGDVAFSLWSNAYDSPQLQQTGSYSTTANALTSQPRNFVYTLRKLNFSGQVRNALGANQLLPLKQIVVDSQGGNLCSQSISYGTTSYYCSAVVTSTLPLSLTYTVSGDWGSKVLTGTSVTTFPAIGAATTVQRNLDVAATTLHVTGTLRLESGAAVPWSYVYLQSPAFVNGDVGVSTGSTGYFDVYVPIKQDTPTGTISFTGSYNGISFADSVPFEAAPGAATPLSFDPTIRERRLRFNGSLVNVLVPGGQPLNAMSLEVKPQGHGTLCTYQRMGGSYWSQYPVPFSTYDCSAVVRGTQPLTVTYTFSGDWGSTAVTNTLTTFPAAGQTGDVTRNLEALPPTLDLSGTIGDPNGAGLPGVRVNVSSSQLGEGSYSASGATGPDGTYHIYVVPRAGITNVSLTYAFTYGQTTIGGGQKSVPLPPAGQLTEVKNSATFGSRHVSLSGKITNELAPSQLVAATAITVTSPQLVSPCVRSGKTYSCAFNATTLDAFAVDYTVAGPWGEKKVSGTVPAGALGSETPLAMDIAVAPTTLHLTGTVTKPGGAALANVTVEADGNDVLQRESIAVDAQGQYDLYVPVGSAAGTVDLNVYYDSATQRESVAYSGTAGTLVNMSHDVLFTSQHVYFDGSIRNALVVDDYVDARKVEISVPGQGKVCDYTSSYGRSYFYCDGDIATTDAVTVTYAISGDWGSATVERQLAAGQLGGYRYVEDDVAVAPTVLHLTGAVRDPTGARLSGAYVELEGDTLSADNARDTSTSTDGSYDFYAILKAGVTSGDLIYRLNYGSTEQRETVAMTATTGAVTPLARNFTISTRQVYFYGGITNALVAGTAPPVGVTKVSISTPALGTLCEYSAASGSSSYGCASYPPTNTLAVSYTLTADWGTRTVAGQVAAGAIGSYQSVEQVLQVSPTTLKLTGTITGTDGAALAGASVKVAGSRVSALPVNNPGGTTGTDGTYSFYVVIKDGVTSGNLDYTITASGQTLAQTRAFTAMASALTEVPQSFSLAQ